MLKVRFVGSPHKTYYFAIEHISTNMLYNFVLHRFQKQVEYEYNIVALKSWPMLNGTCSYEVDTVNMDQFVGKDLAFYLMQWSWWRQRYMVVEMVTHYVEKIPDAVRTPTTLIQIHPDKSLRGKDET